jgi:hypothetical protein
MRRPVLVLASFALVLLACGVLFARFRSTGGASGDAAVPPAPGGQDSGASAPASALASNALCAAGAELAQDASERASARESACEAAGAAATVVGIITTPDMHQRVLDAYTVWAGTSRVPVVIVTSGPLELGACVDLKNGKQGHSSSNVRVWVVECGHEAGVAVACKTSAFFTRAALEFPAAQRFLRVTDDAIVHTEALAAMVGCRLGSARTPRTIGHRHLGDFFFDVSANTSRRTNGRPDHPAGGGWMVSRGALSDDRWIPAFERAVGEAPFNADDVAWGTLILTLVWPRMEPTLCFWQFPPLLAAAPAPCYPWYMCAAAAVGANPLARRRSDSDAVTVRVTEAPVMFHWASLPEWTGTARLAAHFAALSPAGPLRIVVVNSSAGWEPPLDTLYSDAFAAERALCVEVEAAETAKRRRRIDFSCGGVGYYVRACGVARAGDAGCS